MITVHRVRAILKINRNNTASVVGKAHAVANGMEADPVRYAAPVPALAVLQAQIAKVDQAEQRAGTRAKGAAAERNVERAALVNMLETERSYVQTLCDASPDLALAIIEAAGMAAAAAKVRDNPILEATLGTVSGTVSLDANATMLAGKSGKRACFNWQWTADGGATFNTAPSTPHAKTTIGNLAPLTRVGFRVSATTVEGPGAWSQVVTVLVQ
jgi:hypothetical protein